MIAKRDILYDRWAKLAKKMLICTVMYMDCTYMVIFAPSNYRFSNLASSLAPSLISPETVVFK